MGHDRSRSKSFALDSILGVTCLAFATWTGDALGQASGADAGLSYRVSGELGGGTWGPLEVEQGPEVAVARFAGEEEVVLASGPAVGGLPARPLEPPGVLAVLFDPDVDLGPGFRKSLGDASAVVDSFRFELREGDATEEVAGHLARRHVLTARLWSRQVYDDGTEIPVFESGTAELWMASDLPFSWLPFAGHPRSSPGPAFPLSWKWPEVSGALISELGDRLRDLGLLLRARVTDEAHPTNNPESVIQLTESTFERSVDVSDVRPLAREPEAGAVSGLPRLTPPRMASLRAGQTFLRPCRELASAEAGSFEFVTSGAREYLGSGTGALFTAGAGVPIDDAYVLVAGHAGDGALECTALLLPGDAPRPGTFPLRAPGPVFAAPGAGEVATGVHALIDEGALHRVLVLQAGEVSVEEAGPTGVVGRLDAEGWALELHPDHPRRLLEDLEVTLSFEAVPARPEGPGESP